MNRQYAFYVPEMDAIIIQHILNKCEIVFEWSLEDSMNLYEKGIFQHPLDYPMDVLPMIALGEI